MATVADLNTYMDAATAYIAAEDWASALPKLLAAKACLAGLPDGGAGSTYMRWDRNAIDQLIDDVRSSAASASASSASGTSPLQRTSINRVRTSAAT